MKAIIKDMIFSINLKKNLRTNDRVRDVAISYFETYKSYDNMQDFRPLSQKFNEISRFEKFEFLRFCLTLTHRNCHNSIYSSFYVFYKSCLAT